MPALRAEGEPRNSLAAGARLAAMEAPSSSRRRTQPRIYTIQDGRLDDFVGAWTAGIRPLRERLGFVATPWVDREGGRFIWLLEYRGTGTFEEADAAYYASPERRALDP